MVIYRRLEKNDSHYLTRFVLLILTLNTKLVFIPARGTDRVRYLLKVF
jgi:hypothetical protein